MLKLKLTRGFITLVDPDEFERRKGFNWHVSFGGRGDSKPYAARKVRRAGRATSSLLHREILGAGPGQEVDHINGDTLDNRRVNLRLATRSENARNYPKPSHGVTSRFKGVSWAKDKLKWRAVYQSGGKQEFVGYFSTEEAAARAYDAATAKAFQDFAKPNFT